MSSIFDCIFGPSLYRIFNENRSRDYVPFTLERYADLAIRSITFAKSLATLGSPYLVYCFYRNYLSPSANLTDRSIISSILQSASFRLVATLAMVYFVSSVVRGFLRYRNPAYQQFIANFRTATALADGHPDLLKKDDDFAKQVVEARAKLRQNYDYDFAKWPVDFKWSDGAFATERIPTLLPANQTDGGQINDGPLVRAVSWLMAHTIGRIMLYPGSIGLLQSVLNSALVTGRQFLVENYQAKRYKLEARDGNIIDCIFADRRKSDAEPNFKGNTLIVCAEGNAGFYEIGVVTSPLSCGYSVLGWNHPGFGGSTGNPYPQNEINAFDAVINFAVTKLGYKLEDITIFAWSIGGFPAAWAASQYPELKGVILDASFDDVLPLARARMMPFLLPIVDPTIRLHFNLNVSAYLNLYKGPVGLVRRLQDEIIPVDPNDPLRTNRGNFILIKLLQSRFPKMMRHREVYAEVEDFLYTENPGSIYRSIDQETCRAQLLSYIQSNKVRSYPIEMDPDEIGVQQAKSIILYMVVKTLKNYNSTHCTPLPPSMFEEPFNLFANV